MNNFFIFFILIIIFIILYAIIIHKPYEESFENQNNGGNFNFNFEFGTSGVEATGTIKFKNSFKKKPMVFTQINTDSTNSQNLYAVQLFNITESSFDYAKTKMYFKHVNNENVKNTNVLTLGNSTVESFNWIAFG